MKTTISPNQKSGSAGFSLVEISLALAVIASVLVSLMLVMGMASAAASKATRLTTIGHIFTDAHQRMEGSPLRDGQLKGSPYYYDVDGVFV
ncbi:MAG: prepilin-type N-terminal cleavage/methylation domain-containing protein, partial [Verrucomicrobiales bacterium]